MAAPFEPQLILHANPDAKLNASVNPELLDGDADVLLHVKPDMGSFLMGGNRSDFDAAVEDKKWWESCSTELERNIRMAPTLIAAIAALYSAFEDKMTRFDEALQKAIERRHKLHMVLWRCYFGALEPTPEDVTRLLMSKFEKGQPRFDSLISRGWSHASAGYFICGKAATRKDRTKFKEGEEVPQREDLLVTKIHVFSIHVFYVPSSKA